MRLSVMVIDMVRDNFVKAHGHPITRQALGIAATIDTLTAWARELGFPVVFACDSFGPDDFIFNGRMKPHSLRGTPGSQVCTQLTVAESDVVLPKRRFSAFHKTDLDQSLRTWGVEAVAVCGIATPICVLATALDAISHDFRCTIVEDASAAHKPEIHQRVLDTYRKTPLEPLLQVMTAKDLMASPDFKDWSRGGRGC